MATNVKGSLDFGISGSRGVLVVLGEKRLCVSAGIWLFSCEEACLLKFQYLNSTSDKWEPFSKQDIFFFSAIWLNGIRQAIANQMRFSASPRKKFGIVQQSISITSLVELGVGVLGGKPLSGMGQLAESH